MTDEEFGSYKELLGREFSGTARASDLRTSGGVSSRRPGPRTLCSFKLRFGEGPDVLLEFIDLEFFVEDLGDRLCRSYRSPAVESFETERDWTTGEQVRSLCTEHRDLILRLAEDLLPRFRRLAAPEVRDPGE